MPGSVLGRRKFRLTAAKGARRVVIAEFTVEALRRLAERRAAGVLVTQIGRELARAQQEIAFLKTAAAY